MLVYDATPPAPPLPQTTSPVHFGGGGAARAWGYREKEEGEERRAVRVEKGQYLHLQRTALAYCHALWCGPCALRPVRCGTGWASDERPSLARLCLRLSCAPRPSPVNTPFPMSVSARSRPPPLLSMRRALRT